MNAFLLKSRIVLQSFIEKVWFDSPGIFSVILYPVSIITFLILQLRRVALKLVYNKPTTKAVIIVVGNISVGGSGKTPLTINLARFLGENGFTVGVILRGYKAKLGKNKPIIVGEEHTVSEIGDEAAIYRKLGIPVCIGVDRKEAASILDETYDLDLILCDDGLQHYRLHRDVEVLAVDSRGFGNYLALPFGPLREWPLRSKTVDFVLHKNVRGKTGYLFKIVNTGIFSLKDEKMQLYLPSIEGVKIHAVAGIANPKPFFDYLRSIGVTGKLHIFPDHYDYSDSDFPFRESPIVMTEKDGVKCKNLNLKEAYIAKVDVDVDKKFYNDFLNAVREKVDARHEVARHSSLPNL